MPKKLFPEAKKSLVDLSVNIPGLRHSTVIWSDMFRAVGMAPRRLWPRVRDRGGGWATGEQWNFYEEVSYMWPQGIMGQAVPGFEKSRTFHTYLSPRIWGVLQYAGDVHC